MSKAKTVRAPAPLKPSNQDQRPIVRPETVEDAIQHAQKGRVSVTPERAVDMAGNLYSQGKYAQAIKVCRQIIEARSDDADGYSFARMGRDMIGVLDDAGVANVHWVGNSLGGILALLMTWIASRVISQYFIQTEYFDLRLASLGLLGGALIGVMGSALSVGRQIRKVS